MAGRRRSCSSTPAAGCRAAATLDEKVSRAGRGAPCATPTSCCSSSTPTVGVTEDDDAVADLAAPGRARRCCSSPTRSTTTGARHDMLGVPVARPRRAVPGRARCTAGGTGDLLDERRRRCFPPSSPRSDDATSVEDADDEVAGSSPWRIVGRPNVGKSTLFNRLVGDDRSVVHDMPGTTRDAIDTVVETDDGPIRFVDTAGMRRKAQDRRRHRVLLARPRAAGGRRRRRRAARDRRHRRRHRTRTSASPSASTPPAARSSCCSTSGSCSTTEQRLDVARQVERQAPLPRRRAGAEDLGAHRQGRAQAAARARRRDRATTTAACRPARSTRSIADAQSAQPAPGGARVLYATAGRGRSADVHAVRQPRAAAHLPALPRAQAPRGVRPRQHADQAPGAAPVVMDSR